MRHFQNEMPEYVPGSKVEINSQYWKQQIETIAKSILSGMPATLEHCDGGLYVGNAGVAYMFYYLASNANLAELQGTFLEQAVMYTKVSLDYVKRSGSKRDAASFLLGEAGVDALASLVHNATGQASSVDTYVEKYAALAETCKPVDFLKCGSDELFVGRAGYLCGVLNLQKKLGRQIITDATLRQICDAMLESGQKYVRQRRLNIPLMYAYYKTEYLGAAHGIASILHMLLSFPDYLKSSPDIEKTVHAAVDFVLSLEKKDGNYAPATDEVQHQRPDGEQLVHWCHGAPGIIYMLARAYTVWGEDKYLQASLRCGELTWHKGLLLKGPGICHGIAGSGYVFLLLYRLTGDKKHLYRAVKFAEFIGTPTFQEHARTPDTPYSLYEGWAGTVCFLSDLLQPEKAEFPFFDIFMD